MAFFDAFEIDTPSEYEVEFAEATYAAAALGGGAVFTENGFEVDAVPEMAEASYVAAGAIAFSLGFEVPDTLPEFTSIGYQAPAAGQAFTRGFEIDVLARQWLLSDPSLEIFLADDATPFFPRNGLMTEILYPVVPLNEVNRVIFKTDSQEIKAATKGASLVTRRRTIIRYRIDTAGLATFLNDLHANRAIEFRITTPGYTPFGVNSQDNIVRLLGHGAPTREKGGQTYVLDIELLFMRIYTP